MAALATASDMIARYSAEQLGDLCGGVGQRVAEVDLASNSKMTAALSTATGYAKATLLRAEHYSEADLDALTGESLDFLKDIVCRFAHWFLWRRKKYLGDKDPARQEAYEDFKEALQMLKDGAWVLNVTANKEAGRGQVDTATRVDIQSNWELMVDKMRGRALPRRRSYRNR
jgi:phage gp36-like protein